MDHKSDLSTKEKILFTSIELFAEKGYGNVSVREIAKEVGIKASSLYKHYESKEEILERIFEFFKAKLLETQFPAQDLAQYLRSVTPEEYLNQSFALFREVMWNPVIIKISRIITTEQQRNRSVRDFFTEELINKPNQLQKHDLDVMIENGMIGPLDTGIAAEEYNAYIIYLFFVQNFLNSSPDLEEIEKKMRLHNAFFARYVLKERNAG